MLPTLLFLTPRLLATPGVVVTTTTMLAAYGLHRQIDSAAQAKWDALYAPAPQHSVEAGKMAVKAGKKVVKAVKKAGKK
jgi:hypothetical protein